MGTNRDLTPILNANQIVTDHLIQSFINEVDFFYEVVEVGDQLLVTYKDKTVCVIDTTDNKDASSLIEKFSILFASKRNILVDVKVEEVNTEATLVFTLQNGIVYVVQDLTKLFLKLKSDK